MRVLVVGQAPSRDGSGRRRAFDGASGRRLETIIGWPLRDLDGWVFTNLLPSFPGREGRGDAFPIREARRAAEGKRLRRLMRDVDAVVLCGRGVARAFGVHEPFFCWTNYGAVTPPMIVIPHPSGINRAWNDPEATRQARLILRGMAA